MGARLTTEQLAWLTADAEAHIDGHRYDYVLLPDTLLALLAEVTAWRANEQLDAEWVTMTKKHLSQCQYCNEHEEECSVFTQLVAGLRGRKREAISALERLPDESSHA